MQTEPARPYLTLLHAFATQRNLRDPFAPLPEPAEAFTLVRDMPYGRSSRRDVRSTLREWRGTCSTKHEALAAVFREWRLPTDLMACTQELRWPDGLPMPPEVQPLFAEGPILDVHNYLIVRAPQGRTVVDATWPLSARAFGLTANDALVWGQDMRLACEPLQTWNVPVWMSVAAFKDQLLRERCTPQQLDRRDAFIDLLGRLLKGAT